MLKNAKAKGSRIELMVKKWYEGRSPMCQLTKSGGSLGMFDLFGITRYDKAIGIQVKANCWPSPKERCAMERFARCHCQAVVHCVRKDDRQPMRRLSYYDEGWFLLDDEDNCAEWVFPVFLPQRKEKENDK